MELNLTVEVDEIVAAVSEEVTREARGSFISTDDYDPDEWTTSDQVAEIVDERSVNAEEAHEIAREEAYDVFGDSDIIRREVEDLLDSLPESFASRCRLGRSFTNAVVAVMMSFVRDEHDDDRLAELRHRLAGVEVDDHGFPVTPEEQTVEVTGQLTPEADALITAAEVSTEQVVDISANGDYFTVASLASSLRTHASSGVVTLWDHDATRPSRGMPPWLVSTRHGATLRMTDRETFAFCVGVVAGQR